MRNQLNQEIVENLFLSSPQYVKQRDYWKNKLSGAVVKTEIPFFYGKDNDPEAQKREMAETVEIVFPGNLSEKLIKLSNQSDLALYITLLAGLKSLIFRYTNQRDIIVISPIYKLSASEDTINDLLFIRDEIDDDITYKEFLQRISDSTFDAYENQDYPYEKILDQLAKENEKEDNSLLTDFGCLLTNIHGDHACEQIKTRIIFSFVREQEEIKGKILLDANPGESYFIRQMSTHFVNLLESALEDLDINISEIPFLSREEIKQLIEDLNNTDSDFPGDKTIHQLFEEQAAKGASETAISTYLDLTDVYDELASENISRPLLKKLEKCCFAKNPYVFRFEDSSFLEALHIFEKEEIDHLVLLRTHREDIIAVNWTVLWFLQILEGKFNLQLIFDTLTAAINKEELEFWLYPVRLDEKTGPVVGKRARFSLDGKFEEWVALIKALYRTNLIELVDYQSQVTQRVPLGLPPRREKISLPRQSPKEGVEKKYKPGGPVLLLGDTPSTATTGLLYIASFLRRNGIEAYCQWNDFNKTRTGLRGNVERLLTTIQPTVVGISMKWFPHIARVLEICEIVKKYNPAIKVVVGGNTASYYKKQVIGYEWVDYVIAGDGEVPLLKICKGEEDIPNCVYKKNGKIVVNPITYVQDGENSSEIFLSHLEDIFVSELDPYLNYHFYINTGKGCSQQCFYCAGCRDVQVQSFNRKKPFLRGIHEVRQDIIAAKKYTACFMFDFDLPMYDSLDYYEKIWEGIDLSNHFCSFYFWLLPSEEFIDLVVKTFKYVYLNIDMCSLSERHRRKLMSLKVVKPQPTDAQLFEFFESCEKYSNVEVIINHITGLPFFSSEDIEISEDILLKLMKKYSCFQRMDWGRLHAQPGAPLIVTCDKYGMHSYAKTYEDFLYYSQLNLKEDIYPEILGFNYPYIYSDDESLNSKITQFYMEADQKVEENTRKKRRNVKVVFEITYEELSRKSNQLAHVLRNSGVVPNSIVALCAERSAEMIIGLLAILKAGAAYLPFEPKYPIKRITYILKDSNVRTVLTQGDLINTFKTVSFPGNIINIMEEALYPGDAEPMNTLTTPGSAAYVMYTSGSTGNPKGVLVEHGNVVRLVKNCNYIDFTREDRLLITGPIGFDITTFEIWAPLLNGFELVLADQNRILDARQLEEILAVNRISILHLIPQLFNQLAEQRLEIFAGLKYLMVGGDSLGPQYINKVRNRHKALKILHMYGPTENTTFSTFMQVEKNYEITLSIGKPISNSTVYILDKYHQLKPLGAVGEIGVSGKGIARGYLNNPELTFEKFINYKLQNTNYKQENNKKFLRGRLNQWVSGSVGQWGSPIVGKRIYESQGMSPRPHPETKENQHHRFAQYIGPLRRGAPGCRRQRLYKTGDLGRWLPDGHLEFMGRMDYQVKVRGHRIEVGEIEGQLLKHEEIKAAVVLDREDENGDKYLCAYIVPKGALTTTTAGLREYLSGSLPDYMIPARFISIEAIPLTSNGKIDRKRLPDPQITLVDGYTAPSSEVEKSLVEIWSDVLGIDIDIISIDSNFFDLGGHSLKAMVLASKLHKVFNVKIPLEMLFKTPTIRELAKYVTVNRLAVSREGFSAVEPVEKKEYYPLSSAQKRLYVLQQMNKSGTGYNMPILQMLDGAVDRDRLKNAFLELINRHESLRTFFQLIKGEPVQGIRHNVNFEIEYFQFKKDQVEVEECIRDFICPFDLAQAPLMRVGLINIHRTKHILAADTHHIISDGISHDILMQDFISIYEKAQLPEMRIQYKDYSQWQNNEREKEVIRKQEEYWLEEFSGEVPILNLPTDYPRPVIQSFAGNSIAFEIGSIETRALTQMALEQGATLYMVLLTLFYILLWRITGQEDIIIGTPIAGRRHVDLQQIIGMFVNTMALRNYPSGDLSFSQLMGNIKKRTLEAFENQDYQFEELVEKVSVNRDVSRNPLFDVVFVLQDIELQAKETSNARLSGLRLQPYEYETKISKFDLIWIAKESEKCIYFNVEYCVKLFQQTTIEKFINYFKRIVTFVIEKPGDMLFEIDIISEEERRQLLVDFNRTEARFPRNKTLHGLFAEQVERTPHHIAVVGNHQKANTYRELNQKANQLAHLLREKGVQPESIAGIMVERSIEAIIGILAILKAGGAYLPLETDYPGNRIRYMLGDSQAPVLLTQTQPLSAQLFTALQGSQPVEALPHVTGYRSQVTDLDGLPIPDRSLVNYEKYNRHIGQAMVKSSIALQATRGCPYNCAYCHKIWPKKHITRSAEHIFEEVKLYYTMGIRRFVFIDDIFNLNIKNSTRFFELIIENRLEVQLFFPNGLRGDILTKEYIDLMVKAGTVSLALALETASPRLQKMIGKNLNLKKLKENIEYFCQEYPQVILELFIMHGFPTETREEAALTLNFVKELKWLHFPYFHILKIYPHTDMEKLALENGVSIKTIVQSQDLAYHELPETLPFEKSFTLKFQADFFNNYFMSKERLLHVLPYQMKLLTEDEILQKYNSYLPMEFNCFDDLLKFMGISPEELGLSPKASFPVESAFTAVDLNEKIKTHFPVQEPADNALRILLLDLSQFFSSESYILYDVVEPPLGLMSIMTYLNQQLGARVCGKIAKSRIDFDSYAELKQLLDRFQPDIIGIRTLTYYKDFFHKTVVMIRNWGYCVPIIVGGPYATSDYTTILQDPQVDLVVLGEGEITFSELIKRMIENDGHLPTQEDLKEIAGIAFVPGSTGSTLLPQREILVLDVLAEELSRQPTNNLEPLNQPLDTAYVIYTSGTTGKPKGVLVDHRNVVRLLFNDQFQFDFDARDVWSLFHSFCFDFSVWEMYGALLYGGKLIVIPKMAAMDIGTYLEILKEQGVTVLNQTPSAFYTLINLELKEPGTGLHLRYVIFGGEALSPGKLKEWKAKYPNSKLINMFGITETTVHVTFKEIGPREIETNISNIGKPIPTLGIYIMDKHMKLLPVGTVGELCVGGEGVGRGYLNRPELTFEKFINYKLQNTNYTQITNYNVQNYKQKINQKFLRRGPGGAVFSKSAPPGSRRQRLYKSGDLARWLPNGEIEYRGRIDHQVKIRGYRIELGEIESRLLSYDGIKEAVMLARDNEKGDKHLSAYIVAEKEIPIPQLREYLLKNLPVYMVPSYFIPLERIPLTPNGKLDRKALPRPEFEAGEDYTAPQDEIEEKLAEIWSEVLEIKKENISIDDDFFELGGHSLKAAIMLDRIHKEFNLNLSLAEIFQMPTVKAIADLVKIIDWTENGRKEEPVRTDKNREVVL